MKQYMIRLLVMACLIAVADSRAQSIGVGQVQNQGVTNVQNSYRAGDPNEAAFRQAEDTARQNRAAVAMDQFEVSSDHWQLVVVQRNAPKLGTPDPHYMSRLRLFATEEACFVELRKLNVITAHAVNPAGYAACVPAP